MVALGDDTRRPAQHFIVSSKVDEKAAFRVLTDQKELHPEDLLK
jgi:hypothetical protein